MVFFKKEKNMHGMPGGFEWIGILFIGCFAFALKLLFVVFVIIYLVKIKASLDKIESRLNDLEQRRTQIIGENP